MNLSRCKSLVCQLAVVLLAGCGGGGGGGGGGVPVAVAPTITSQPASVSVTAGTAASFTVAASGDAPLAYQWQRNGADIAGATAPTYVVAATSIADSGAAFRAVVANAAGTATSSAATLTVAVAPPVLTVTAQPANASVVAGASASFVVAATCSSGTLGIQWQRGALVGGVLTFADVAGAIAATLSVATALTDTGAQFRAALNCSGMSATTSTAALLTVTAPPTAMLAAVPLANLRDQALILGMKGIDQLADGSFAFIANGQVMRLSADFSAITLLAGTGSSGSTDGPALSATFAALLGVAHDAAGNIYVTDNECIRRIGTDAMVSTLAGTCGSAGSADGTGAAARFSTPHGIALGADGDLYVAEQGSSIIRRVTTAGVVTRYAGFPEDRRYIDGAALAIARFSSPAGIAVASNGDVFVGDTVNNAVRRIRRSGSVAGNVDTLAGNGTPTSIDGIGTAATVENPMHVGLLGNTLSVRERFGRIRQVDIATAVVTTLTGTRQAGEAYADGTKTTARVYTGFGLAAMANGSVMLADVIALRVAAADGRVRTVAVAGAAGTTATGTGTLAQMPFASPQAVVADTAGNIVIADRIAKQVRRIDASGVVTLAAGLFNSFDVGVDGTGSEAQFLEPGDSIASDGAGGVYASDRYAVRRIGAGNVTTTVAGNAFVPGAVDGSAAVARFGAVFGLAAGAGGSVFVSDGINHAVRRIDAAGNVGTYAGVLGQNALVDGVIAVARFRFPGTLALGPDGALYVADSTSASTTAGQVGVIRRIAPDGASVSTVAGVALAGSFTVDSAGSLFYGSTAGLMKLTAGGVSSLVVPRGPAIVLGASPQIVGVDAIAVLGPNQLVLLSGQKILKLSLP